MPHNHWTDRIAYEIMGNDAVCGWFHHIKQIEAIKGGPTLYTKHLQLNLAIGMGKATEALETLGFKQINHDLNDEDVELYMEDSAVVRMFSNTFNKRIDIQIQTIDICHVGNVEEVFKSCLVEDEREKGEVLILQQGAAGLDFQSFGKIDEPFETGNYSEDVLSGYDYIVEQINTAHPSGRIVLLEGPPGTGKSFFIRGLIYDVEAKFVVCPTTLLPEISGPSFIPALIDLHEEEPYGVPIVLVVEDADSLIANRKMGNVDVLSTVLNVGDGLMGQMFDIRMLLSTNANSRVDIAPALLRPGRLNTQVIFDTLEHDKALEIFDRINKDDRSLSDKKTYTLAEIYGEAMSSRAMGATVQFGENIGGAYL